MIRFGFFLTLFIFLVSCSSEGKFFRQSYPDKFKLNAETDVMETLNGNTFVANVKNIHPVFGEALTIKVRGLKVDSIETEDSSSASRAFRQWHKFSNLLKEASDIELRNLERGRNGFWIWADVYIDGEILGDLY
ncbi:MAG: hypothetical protein CMI23_07395 [Opitutae bacterium]|nr:hypothetical protein [Opitutae bacterium]|tara:strand:+ start:425 stop:826 length:402 start_codon:yes stop_codon:yes gene_type:complete